MEEKKISEQRPGPKEDIKIIEGKKYRRVNTGYTMREYFSHHTEKGPGPGWDFRWRVLKKYGVSEPSELPDELYYLWELVDEKQ